MLTLHLEAESHEALTRLAIKTLGIVAVEEVAKLGANLAAAAEAREVAAAPAATLPAPVPHTPRPGRKPRQVPPAAATPPSPAAAPSPEAPAAAATPPAPQAPVAAVAAPAASGLSIPTLDELRTALSDVNSVFGMAVCTSMLSDFGAQRVSLVPEDKRAEFIAACKEKIAKNAADVAASKAAKA
jgi:hypothetical protein